VSWEANGGFLTGSAIEKDGRELLPLPTRDAVLPLLCALYAACEKKCRLVDLFERLPRRFSKAGLIDEFPQEASQAILRRFCPANTEIVEIEFDEEAVYYTLANGYRAQAEEAPVLQQHAVRQELAEYFAPALGFTEIVRMNMLDGLRIYFRNGDIAHIRPSGNAPQLRMYAVADTQQRANEIVSLGLREPDGILRRLMP
jgi:phosphomannomutase